MYSGRALFYSNYKIEIGSLHPETAHKNIDTGSLCLRRWIDALQLDRIYTAPYYLALLALLAASLAACSTTTQWPMVKVAQRWRFVNSASRLSKLEGAEQLPDADVKDFGRILNSRGYQVFLKVGAEIPAN